MEAAHGISLDPAAIILLAKGNNFTNGTNSTHGAQMVVTTADLTEAEVQRRQIFFGALIAASSGAVCLGGVAVFLKRRWMQQAAAQASAPERKAEAKYAPLRDEEDQAAQPEPSSSQAGAGLGALDSEELEEAPAAAADQAAEEAKRDAWAQRQAQKQRAENADYLRRRWWALMTLFASYVSASIGLPLAHAQEATCSRGAFWEVHMQFLASVLLTKVAELWYCVSDETLEWGNMSLWVFFLRFLPSFLGYLDGYTDANGVVIAHACQDTFAQWLSVFMLVDFVVGVVCVQWVYLLWHAARDPSQACLMKLLHMDLMASVITLPPEQKPLWDRIALLRTFGEDLPQAVLQTLYLLYVRRNPVMLASVVVSVGSSIKALHDARSRALATAAAAEAFETRERDTELYTCSDDRTIRSWDAKTGACKRTMQAATDVNAAVNAIAATRGMLYSGHDDGWVREWSLDTGEETRRFEHPGLNVKVYATADKLYTYQVWSSADSCLKQWSLDSGQCTRTWQTASGEEWNAVCVRGDWLYAANGAKVGEWRLDVPEEESPARTFTGEDEIRAIVATKKRLLTADSGRVREWSLASGACTRTFDDFSCYGSGGALLHIRQGVLFFSAEDHSVVAYSFQTGELVSKYKQREGSSNPISSIAFLEGKLYAANGDGLEVQGWDLATCAPQNKFQGHTDTVRGLVVQHRDGD